MIISDDMFLALLGIVTIVVLIVMVLFNYSTADYYDVFGSAYWNNAAQPWMTK